MQLIGKKKEKKAEKPRVRILCGVGVEPQGTLMKEGWKQQQKREGGRSFMSSKQMEGHEKGFVYPFEGSTTLKKVSESGLS